MKQNSEAVVRWVIVIAPAVDDILFMLWHSKLLHLLWLSKLLLLRLNRLQLL
jgi:hypothetical protein